MQIPDIVLLKEVGTAIIVLAALVGGAAVLFGRRFARGEPAFLIRGEALAAGVFLGAGLIHMLGDASSGFIANGIDYPLAEVLAGCMVLLLLWLEHLGGRYADAPIQGQASLALLGTAMLSIHAFLAGAAFGTGEAWSSTLIIFVAILAHKWAASFALAAKLAGSGLSRWTIGLCFGFFLLVFPLGVLLGSEVAMLNAMHPVIAPCLIALAAGTFIYLGTLHGLANGTLVARCCNVAEFSLVVAGFALMAVVAVWT